MTRVRWRDFNQGLWIAGGRDDCPDAALRRATGISALKERAIRSARGLRQLNLFGANQYVSFDDALFQGTGVDVLREGVAVNASFPQSGVRGLVGGTNRLSFLRMPPQPDLVDWLFVAGGNNPFKVKSDGTSASQWGIDAPPDGFVASTDAPLGNTKLISTCDTAADWVRVEAAGATPTDEASITVDGAGSVFWAFTQAGTNRYENTGTDFATPLNLQHFGTGLTGSPSSDQDYIDFWIRLANPDPEATGDNSVSNFEWMEIAFAIGAANFDDNAFSRRINGENGNISQAGLADQQRGTGSYTLDNNLSETDVVSGANVFNDAADQRSFLDNIGQTVIFKQNDVWQRIRIPKSTFDRVGSDETLGWDDVQACRVTFRRSGKINIYFDQLNLTGGYGLQGNYKYFLTYLNSTTGSRSNPNPTPVEIKAINRGRVILGNLPTSTDPQVDKLEVWRTVGNGELYFKALEVDNGDVFVTDDVADFRGLFNAAYLTDADLPDVLENLELELDNDPPPSTITEVYGAPHVGRAWWLDSDPANRGNVYYSPIGRPESNGGFVSVTTQTDNQTQTIRRWNDVLYVFTTFGLYRIVGETEPFVAQEVFGVPGMSAPDTAVETPYGLVWQAPEGIVLFDGAQAIMLGMDALGPILRGYDAEGLDAFTGISAGYWREDYWITDGNQVLVCNLRTQTWRHFDLSIDTLYAKDDDTQLIGAVGYVAPGITFSLEDESADTAITFQVQTPSQLSAVDTKGIIQRVLLDIDTDDVAVTPTLIYADSEVTLAVCQTSARQTVEYARLDESILLGVRLDASVTTETILLYGVEVDVYVPAGTGSE